MNGPDCGYFVTGVRQEQDIFVRLIDSVTKQVSKSSKFLKLILMLQITYSHFCIIRCLFPANIPRDIAMILECALL